MRDTAKTRVARIERALTTSADEHTATRIVRFARRAQEPLVTAPFHGAEYVRHLLFFADELAGPELREALSMVCNREHVTYEPGKQVAAAVKQVRRLKSDLQLTDSAAKYIPIDTIVFALDSGDFTGGSYVRLEGVEIPVASVDDGDEELVIRRRGHRNQVVPFASLRYVEGPMIRRR